MAFQRKILFLSRNFLLLEVISQEAITRLLVEKGVFSKEEFLEMVKVVNKTKKRGQ